MTRVDSGAVQEIRATAYSGDDRIQNDVKQMSSDAGGYMNCNNAMFAAATGCTNWGSGYSNKAMGRAHRLNGGNPKGDIYEMYQDGNMFCNCWEDIVAVKRGGNGPSAMMMFGDNGNCWPHGRGGCSNSISFTSFWVR